MLFNAGSTLADGRYVLERRLGAGGMATVWLATDTRLQRTVAVKLPTDALSADETFQARFEREARTAASVSHPNLVSVFDYGAEGDRPYLVSEYIEGATLAALRDRDEEPATAVLAEALLSALEHIHGYGIVHRDVKPGNVLVEGPSRILLTDFGIAQPAEASSLTATGQMIGTLRYIAPEVKRGERAGPAADLYACGVVLSEQLLPADPDAVHGLVDQLTADDPGDRPADAERALELLDPRSAMPLRSRADTEPTRPVDPTTEAPPPLDDDPPPVRPEEPAPQRTINRGGPQLSRALPGLALLAVGLIALVIIVVALSGGDEETPPGAAGDEQAQSERGGGGSGGQSEQTTEEPPPGGGETASSTGGLPEPISPSDPVLGKSLNQEGFALLNDGDVDEALPVLEQAVASFPPNSQDLEYGYALFNYAQALRLAGQSEAAIPVLEKRLTIPDQTETVEAALAEARAEAGE